MSFKFCFSLNAIAVSLGSSVELTDSTGVNLEDFIICTLHKNKKDREMLLKLEEDMTRFIQSESVFTCFFRI